MESIAEYLKKTASKIKDLDPDKESSLDKFSIRMRIKPPKRRSPLDRLKARLYYRRNRAKIRVQRRKYLRKHKTTLKNRKLFQRYKPVWFKKPRPKLTPKRPKKFKVTIPHKTKLKKPKFFRPHK